MRSLALLPFLFSIGIAGVLPHTQFEKDIANYLDVDEFKKDMQVLNSQPLQTEAQRAEVKQLLTKIAPISSEIAAAQEQEEALNAANMDDLFEGDILLNNEQLALLMANETNRAKRQVTTIYKSWGTGPIPYSFHHSIPEKTRALVRAAARFWNENTCVNFQENAQGNDRILVVQQGKCFAALGRGGGEQPLSLPTGGCDNFSTASHEMEHSLGVFHEHERADRDQYVRINEDNLYVEKSTFYANRDTTSYGLPYEFGSNMHYSEISYAKNPSIPTIVAVGAYAEYQDGMRGHSPSFLDVIKVNKFYECDKKCARMHNPCKNCGYLDVRTCSRCVCPEGIGGSDCTGNPSGRCVEELTATPSLASKTIQIGDAYAPAKVDFDQCAVVIKAPSGRRIEITVGKIIGYGISGCRNNGLEIKTKRDMAMRGFRFCATPNTTKRYVSETNRAVALAYNNEGKFEATFTYRYSELAAVQSAKISRALSD